MARAEEAIVLVGGLGTRLRGELGDLPKPLAPVAGRPFLALLLDELAAGGVRRAILATGYGSAQVEAAIGRQWQGMEVDYSVEDSALGTGGAIALAARKLQGEAAFAMNGDTFLRFDPSALARSAGESAMSMALARVVDVSRYGAVEVSEGRVQSFSEKGGTGPGFINAGSYFLRAEAFASFPKQAVFSFEEAVLRPLAQAGRVAAFTDTRDFIDIGVPEDYRLAQARFGAAPRKALFLDRDGVINVDTGYVHTPEGTKWVRGIFDLCRAGVDLGYVLVVVTNQAGIARGYYDEATFHAYSDWQRARFAERGLHIEAVYHCPHHPIDGCECRKPQPGMLLRAAEELGLDLAASALIGDRPWDIEAAQRAGVGRAFHLGVDGGSLADATDWLKGKF